MANVNVILSGFSYGELDPKLAARVDFAGYTRGVKTAQNVLSIPQGGFQNRFGTSYRVTSSTTNKNYATLESFTYDDKAIYNLLVENNSIKVYLENTLNATVVTTYPEEIVKELYFIFVNERVIILHPNYVPRQLIRSAAAANAITGVDATNDYINITNALTAGVIYPATFTTGGTLPVSDPSIFVNTTYYIRAITATSVRVYATPTDAASDTNYFDITATGTGNVIVQNSWAISDIPFSIYPSYDFDGFATYSASGFTFTASATSGTVGTPVTITASGNIFSAAYVGGLFVGNGGILRITGYTNPTTITGYTYEDFTNTSAFPGSESFLGEPAWSAARGYPSCGTFFQERLFLGGSRSIPNGVWGSTIFSVFDFDDSQNLDDNAISYYPASGGSNVIKSMLASKTLLIFSNSGNYSTTLTSDLPLTPQTFSLVAQSKDGVNDVVPVEIDNQILYVDKSANNVKSMAWDIVQSSYVNTNISLPSSHLVQDPIDMAVYSEPNYTDGYYLLVVNEDGTMAIYNSLTEQDIKGWTKANTGASGLVRDITASENRCWVLVERLINGNQVLYVEEIDFTVRADSAVTYDLTAPSNTLTGLSHLEGETVQVYGDSIYQGAFTVSSGQITIDNEISEGFAGLQYICLIEPWPINLDTREGPTLYQLTHIRSIHIHYYESLGMTFQGYDIPTQEMQQVLLNTPVPPATGVYEYTLMEGWESFEYNIQIKQELPQPMTLLGIGYEVELP